MKRASKLRIVIADDHFIVRMGLVALVDTEPDMQVVAEAADGVQAVELYARFKPDLVLMDLRMPLKSGFLRKSPAVWLHETCSKNLPLARYRFYNSLPKVWRTKKSPTCSTLATI